MTRSVDVSRGIPLYLMTALLFATPLAAQTPEWISQHAPGAPGATEASAYFAPPPFRTSSDDGRYVAFYRDANQSVGPADVFVRDRLAGTTELISVSNSGAPGNARSLFPLISGDGRTVIFTSFAKNLVPGDENDRFDVFLRDRSLGETRAISVNRFGTSTSNGSSTGIATSLDASVILFVSTASDIVPEPPSFFELYLVDLKNDEVRMLTLGADGTGQGIGLSFLSCAISDDGRRVVFTAEGDGLVPEDANGEEDIFLFDRDTDEIRLLSKRFDGQGSGRGSSILPAITPDGRFATFQSDADDLVPGDSNRQFDVFRVDLDTEEVQLVSVDEKGFAGSGSNIIYAVPSSASGRFVAFGSPAPLLPEDQDGGYFDVYVRDMLLGLTYLVSEDEGSTRDHSAFFPFLTPDGSRVGFMSNPLDEDEPTQILARRLLGGPLELISQRNGEASDRDASFGASMPNGREVLFFSEATNLGGGGADDFQDLFIAPLPQPAIVEIPTASDLALVTLGLCLLALGVQTLRRRIP